MTVLKTMVLPTQDVILDFRNTANFIKIALMMKGIFVVSH